jgi:hypothetical protein
MKDSSWIVNMQKQKELERERKEGRKDYLVS